ncbi:hypothetical protein G4228_008465 [Cervus hanglu yarkandensis]|nr:hypothetical protein G4228_008465 [Cervus hanglu yarkandensis]
MRCLLLALGLALACGRKVPPQVAGTWHVVAMAASDVSLLDAESGLLSVYVEELKPTPQGDLEVLLQKRENHKCVEKTLMAQKTEDPAVFTVDSRTPEVDDEVMEKFDGALASLHIQMVLDLRQGAGELGRPSSLPRPPGRRGWGAAPRGGPPLHPLPSSLFPGRPVPS